MKFLLLSVGKTHDKIYVEAIQEFTKRLQNYYTTEWRFVQTKNNTIVKNKISVQKAEAELLLSAISKDDYVVLLDEKGEMMNSPQLAEFMQKHTNRGFKRLVFIIGGVYGVNQSVLDKVQFIWSLSPLVFPSIGKAYIGRTTIQSLYYTA